MHFLRKGLASGMGCAIILVLALGSGCSGGDDDDDGGESGEGGGGGSGGSGAGGTGGSGAPICGDSKCPAGQYCVAGVSCMPGCTADENCADDQRCGNIDDVSHVGTCEDIPMKDCPGYLEKCDACGGGELCTQQVCDAFSLDCINCVAESSCSESGECPCRN
jgi:hypothetical protein